MGKGIGAGTGSGAEGEMPEVGGYRSTSEIAKLFNRSSRQIQMLTADGVLPTVGRGNQAKYELLPTVQRYVRHLQERLDRKSKTTAEKRKDEAAARYQEAKAEKCELELQELRGQMHRSEDVAAMTEDLIWTVRGLVLALPGRVAMDAANARTAAEASDIVRRECCKALEELSRYEYDSERYMERVRRRVGMELEADDVIDESERQEAE